MSVQEEYRKVVLKQIIQDLLEQGINPTINDITSAFNTFIAENDLSQSQFNDANFQVEERSESSASLYNSTNQHILDDLIVLYKNMFLLTRDSMDSFDRWRTEISTIETQLNRLEDRINGLLLITEDTAGFFNFVSDTFTDATKVDIPNSSITVDLNREHVTLSASNPGATRVLLDNVDNDDIEFIVLTRQNLNAVVQAEGSQLSNAFNSSDNYWQHRVFMSEPDSVSSELSVQLSEDPVSFSRITLHLHTSNSNSAIQITPLYSQDGFNFQQLPTETFSQSVLENATFTFPAIQATHVKFIMSKNGFDIRDDLLYIYEFGVNEIAFYSEGYSANTSGTFFSKALSVTDPDGNVDDFNQASLEVCENIPESASIEYFLAASNDPGINPNDLNWASIDPFNRTEIIDPTVLNFTDLTRFEFGNTTNSGEWVQVSYNTTTTSGIFVNPGPNYKLIDISGASAVVTDETTTGLRYSLPTRNERILNYQVHDDVDLKNDQLSVFRNLGLQNDRTQVRGIQAGWGFVDPYYSTTIEILNSNGIDLDFGGSDVIIDGVAQKGEIHIDQGIHTVQVHKRNWIDVNPDNLPTNNEDGLESIDPLYPNNHKLLIEGFKYPSGFEGEQVYQGVDLFAEMLMQQVSSLDIFRTISNDDYRKFGIDFTAQDGSNNPSRVVVLKTDASNPDFINERFVIRFKINTSGLKFNYVWLRADLTTDNLSAAPILDEYRIKLGR